MPGCVAEDAVAYLASIAVINGARSVDGVLALVQRGFFGMLKVCYILIRSSAAKTLPDDVDDQSSSNGRRAESYSAGSELTIELVLLMYCNG